MPVAVLLPEVPGSIDPQTVDLQDADYLSLLMGAKMKLTAATAAAPTTFAVPPGDDRGRFLCAGLRRRSTTRTRGWWPGASRSIEDRVLLCRRAIEPCYGKWTLPAGYLENGETVAACAERETREETGARVGGLAPVPDVQHLPHQPDLFHVPGRAGRPRATAPGKESLEVKLFTEAEIPWEQIAFRVITETLARLTSATGAAGAFPFSDRRHRAAAGESAQSTNDATSRRR
ncbi:MAG: NUDIX domain-containing protein [Desulfobacterales bacterium]|nr:NUDIX domain-containing protein [Desulfobacterales bacterium]